MQFGALAQLGEHLLCKQGVIGSIPIGSTIATLAVSIEDEDTPFRQALACWHAGFARIFDIVNGFFNRRGNACRFLALGFCPDVGDRIDALLYRCC